MTSSRTMTRTLALASAFVLVVAACGSGTASQAPAATAGASADPGASQGASPEANACGTEPLTLNVWGGYPEVDDTPSKLAGRQYLARRVQLPSHGPARK